MFDLVSKYKSSGDQPEAIKVLIVVSMNRCCKVQQELVILLQLQML